MVVLLVNGMGMLALAVYGYFMVTNQILWDRNTLGWLLLDHGALRLQLLRSSHDVGVGVWVDTITATIIDGFEDFLIKLQVLLNLRFQYRSFLLHSHVVEEILDSSIIFELGKFLLWWCCKYIHSAVGPLRIAYRDHNTTFDRPAHPIFGSSPALSMRCWFFLYYDDDKNLLLSKVMSCRRLP